MYAVRVIVNQKSCLYKYLKLAAGRDTNRDSIKEFLPCLSLFQGISEAAEDPKKWLGQQKYIVSFYFFSLFYSGKISPKSGGEAGPTGTPSPFRRPWIWQLSSCRGHFCLKIFHFLTYEPNEWNENYVEILSERG